jgi:FMN phosphatase YigB (HAD superfamily)
MNTSSAIVVFDAYGTLFDVYSIGAHKDALMRQCAQLMAVLKTWPFSRP